MKVGEVLLQKKLVFAQFSEQCPAGMVQSADHRWVEGVWRAWPCSCVSICLDGSVISSCLHD